MPSYAQQNSLADVIHIGFPKTGTTFLQNIVFPQVKSLACLGKPYTISLAYRDVLHELITTPDLEFSPEYFREKIGALNSTHTSRIRNHIKLISFELLSGFMYRADNAKQIADRLRAIFDRAKILMTIREQKSIIESIYKYYVLAGGPLTFQDFLNRRKLSPCVDEFRTRHMLLKFKYHLLIQHYFRLFGKENVLVLPFELLRRNPNDFLNRMLTFFEVENCSINDIQKESNVGLSYYSTSLLRIMNLFVSTPYSTSPLFNMLDINFFYRKVIQRLDKAVFRRIPVNVSFVNEKNELPFRRFCKKLIALKSPDDNRSIADIIEKNYMESNTITSALIRLDLSSFGYSTAAPAKVNNEVPSPEIISEIQ